MNHLLQYLPKDVVNYCIRPFLGVREDTVRATHKLVMDELESGKGALIGRTGEFRIVCADEDDEDDENDLRLERIRTLRRLGFTYDELNTMRDWQLRKLLNTQREYSHYLNRACGHLWGHDVPYVYSKIRRIKASYPRVKELLTFEDTSSLCDLIGSNMLRRIHSDEICRLQVDRHEVMITDEDEDTQTAYPLPVSYDPDGRDMKSNWKTAFHLFNEPLRR